MNISLTAKSDAQCVGAYASERSLSCGRASSTQSTRVGPALSCPERSMKNIIKISLLSLGLFRGLTRGLYETDAHEARLGWTTATWLILPVIICLSQRLSHACLSASQIKVKPRKAHYISYGSIDRTSVTWITAEILELIHANRVPTGDGRDAFIRSKPIGGFGHRLTW